MKTINKNIICVILILAIVLAFAACGQKPLSWQEQYDLGIRYLTEGNYEEAIIAFEAVIRINSKQPEAYLGLAYAYIGQGEYEAAKQILEEGVTLTGGEELQQKLDEILGGRIIGYDGLVRRESVYDGSGTLVQYTEYSYQDYGENGRKQSVRSCYDGAGVLLYRHTFDYDESGMQCAVTAFSADGSQIGHVDLEFTKERQVTYSWNSHTGQLYRDVHEYDDHGNEIHWVFDEDEEHFYEYEYDAQGRILRQDSRQIDKSGYEFVSITYYEYDEAGRKIKESRFEPDGNLISSDKYEYNADGQIATHFYYDGTNKLKSKIEYIYDESGHRIESNQYDGNGNLTESRTYN